MSRLELLVWMCCISYRNWHAGLLVFSQLCYICQHVLCLSLIGITLLDVGGPVVIILCCMIFRSSFLDVIRMSILTVSFLTQLNSHSQTLTYDLNSFKSRVNRNLFSLGSFHSAFLYAFHFRLLLFLLTLCLAVAVQLMERILIKKTMRGVFVVLSSILCSLRPVFSLI